VTVKEATGPGLTVNVGDAVEVVMAPLAAAIRAVDPSTVGVRDTASTKPFDVMTASTLPTKAAEVRVTVPVHDELVLPWASCAETRTPKGTPACFSTADSAVAPPVIVTPNFVTVPATPVAVIVTGEPVSPVAVAVSVFVPAVVPRVQEVRAAMPEAFVATLDVGLRMPSPLNVTDLPATGLPTESVTMTDGAVATAVSTVAV
jgi:hypothetical protein